MSSSQNIGRILNAASTRTVTVENMSTNPPPEEETAEAEDRAIPGHWEGDLLAGGKNSYIATIKELRR